MGETEELHMTSRYNWRSWLEKNHEIKKEVWLIFYKKHTGKPNVTYDEAVEVAGMITPVPGGTGKAQAGTSSHGSAGAV